MTTRCLFLVLAVLAVASACGPSVKYERGTSRTFPAYPAGCPLDVLSVVPNRAFVELGTAEIDDVIETPTVLAEKLRPTACPEGADAIIARKERNGFYEKAIVIRYEDATVAPDAETEEP
jgi:hypothetical protein